MIDPNPKTFLISSRVIATALRGWTWLEQDERRAVALIQGSRAWQAMVASLRAYPVRGIGILLVSAVLTHAVVSVVWVGPTTGWAWGMRALFLVFGLCAVFSRDSWRSFLEGSIVVRGISKWLKRNSAGVRDTNSS